MTKETNLNSFTRVVVLGDTHCGSESGLTPSSFDVQPSDSADDVELEMWEARRGLWGWFSDQISSLGQIDVAIYNGDLIDGNQSRSSGYGLITNDRLQQAAMAERVVKTVKAKKNYFVSGTAYHTGPDEDFESLVASEFDEKISKEKIIDVNGTIIHATHHMSGSGMNHTRQNALGKEIIDLMVRCHKNDIDADHVHILVRSHCHYSGSLEDHGTTAIRVPALQLENHSKWARKFPNGKLEYGFVVIDVYAPGIFTTRTLLYKPPAHQSDVFLSPAAEKVRKDSLIAHALKNIQPSPKSILDRP